MSITVETLATPARPRRKYARYGPHRFRMAFRRWRRSRPFWGGLLAILGGGIITLGPASAYKVMLQAGDVIWMGIVVGALVTIFGLFLWYQPAMRHFFGVLIVVLSLVSFITSDIGGFIIGMLLAMTGGAMGFAWVPVDPAKVKPHVWRRQARHDWRQRQRMERAARRRALEEEEEQELALAEVPVAGVPVAEPAVEVPTREVPGREQPAPAETPVEAGAIEATGTVPASGAIEATGEEVERLPKAEAGIPADEAAAPHRRRFPFGPRGR